MVFTYSAMLPVRDETLLYLSRLLYAERRGEAPGLAPGRWAASSSRA